MKISLLVLIFLFSVVQFLFVESNSFYYFLIFSFSKILKLAEKNMKRLFIILRFYFYLIFFLNNLENKKFQNFWKTKIVLSILCFCILFIFFLIYNIFILILKPFRVKIKIKRNNFLCLIFSFFYKKGL